MLENTTHYYIVTDDFNAGKCQKSTYGIKWNRQKNERSQTQINFLEEQLQVINTILYPTNIFIDITLHLPQSIKFCRYYTINHQLEVILQKKSFGSNSCLSLVLNGYNEFVDITDMNL